MTTPPGSQSEEDPCPATSVEETDARKRPRILEETRVETVLEDDSEGGGDDDCSSDSSVEFLRHLPSSSTARSFDAGSTGPTGVATLYGSEDHGSFAATSIDTQGKAASRSLSEGAASEMTETMAMEGGSDIGDASPVAPAPAVAAPITPLRSAYLQNLAEICFTILHDHRWRVGTAREPLFQWEHGDDLSIVLALSRRFILPPRMEDRDVPPCNCLLCQDEELVLPERRLPCPRSRPGHPMVNDIVQEEDEDCSLYLYCRLFYRKGPWFRLDDLYKRYYASSKESSTPSAFENGSLEEPLLALQRLLEDLARLYKRGFVQGFSSEEDCGRVVGEGLLSNAERGQVLFRMAVGGKRGRAVPCPPGPAILKQMKRQRPLFVDGRAGAAASCLPVRRHVVAVMLDSLARAVARRALPNHEPATAEVAHLKERIERMVLESGLAIDVMSGLRLRAEPHRTLARCGRLYLCATSGPGTMRGDGTNGWRSLISIESPVQILGIDPPGIHAWHMAEYPGLKARFGLSSYPFQSTFQFLLNGEPGQQIFASHAQFLALECCIELRAHVDFILEVENVSRYNERRMARGLRPLGDASFQSADERNLDFLWLTRPSGREKLVRALLRVCGRGDDLIISSIEQDIEVYSDNFSSQCQKIIMAVAAIARHVLRHRNETISNAEYEMMAAKPWLRHLWWDGNLAYILWDTIQILEKKSHSYAVLALETLLFGKRISANLVRLIPEIDCQKPSTLAQLLLSRRTRGKAIVRLFVDYRHVLKEGRAALENDKKKIEKYRALQAEAVYRLFDRVILQLVAKAAIPFSSVRELARSVRQPLSVTLRDIYCLEAFELGLRLQDASTELRMDRYSEWAPKVDKSVANTVINDKNGPGSRCVYIGFEDENHTSSLSVEELAIEYYSTGRLPYDDEKGGWRGFHDEGSHLHALFRIICARPILGTDWGCGHARPSNLCPTIHVSPYQGAPFDLLVGHEMKDRSWSSFYDNRATAIRMLFRKLETLSKQQLSDLVYDSVLARLNYMQSTARSDLTSLDDMSRVRTLSLIAAGFGGKALSSIFRCFCFDYRHFRGGMPDLLLVRASVRDDLGDKDIIDLSKWIGESFSRHDKAAMMPGDEDFLGCSMGESGNSKANKRTRVRTRVVPVTLNCSGDAEHSILIPERLQLTYDNHEVHVETMMVEVKSANDRLDSRQQDWLNILDIHANARVCKFEKSESKEKLGG